MIKDQLTGAARNIAGEYREEAVNLHGSKAKHADRLSLQVRGDDQEVIAGTKDLIEDDIWPEHPLWPGARP